jgi:hypothetical protein
MAKEHIMRPLRFLRLKAALLAGPGRAAMTRLIRPRTNFIPELYTSVQHI